MKSISIFVILLFSQLIASQTYVLDSSFGDNGQIQYNISSFQPSNVILSNNNYYYLGSDKVVKTNYLGELQNSFGLNSVLTFPGLPSNQYRYLQKLIYTNDAFYAFGYVDYDINSVASDDIIIYKFDENGILDPTFGSSGAARIDLGDKESVSNIIVKADGSIYCSGTRSNKIVYFKLTPQGILDYNFDPTGYKTITHYPNSSFGYLIPNGNGDYFLIGLYKDSNDYGILVITKLNENGLVDTSFGDNGYKISQLNGGIGVHEIEDVQLYQNKLYIQHRYAFSQVSNSSYLKIFDLNTDQSIYDLPEGYDIDFIVRSDGIYIAQLNYCGLSCTGVFTLCKRNLNGELDTTFHNNGIYTYNFPNTGAGYPPQGLLRCLQISESGEILLSGFTYFVESKFASIRIIPGALGLSGFNSSELSIQPNPFNTEISIKTQGQISDLTVYSLNGAEIYKPKISSDLNGTITIDLTSIKNSGVYILKFYSDDTQITQKLIKY